MGIKADFRKIVFSFRCYGEQRHFVFALFLRQKEEKA